LDEGISVGRDNEGTHRIGPDEASRIARRAYQDWQHEIRIRAQNAPNHRFNNLAASELKRRLAVLATAHDFDIVRVEFVDPRQLAPVVIVRTTHYVELAKATASILRQIDPKVRTNDDRTGWRYEGFFFEARDEHGVPFLGVFNFLRGPGGGGGGWARSEKLFPFPHL
jgi:hypothetical protein